MALTILFKIYAFIFGALFGSFTNVVIYRLPEEKSVVFPRSHCPVCKKLIPWFENLPILSFFILSRKCSGCAHPIPWQYPLVEIFAAIISCYLWPMNPDFISILNYLFFFFVFLCFLAHFLIDLKHYILPDEINIFLAVLFLVASLYHHNWTFTFSGGLVGFLFPFCVAYFYHWYKGQVGLGLGDVKLFTVLGLYLGPIGILQNIFLSCTIGSVVGIGLMISKKINQKTPVPFGPFIIVAASIQIYFPKMVTAFTQYLFTL